MIPEETIKWLKAKFIDLHPLIFQRSLERSRTGGELFDILSTFSNEYPVFWCEKSRKWLVTTDIFQVKDYLEKNASAR
jgi:hypothetical protein